MRSQTGPVAGYTVLNANENDLIRIRLIWKKLALHSKLYGPARSRTGMDGDVHTSLVLNIVGDLIKGVCERTEVLEGDGTDGIKNVIVIVKGLTLTAALLTPRLSISVLD